MDTTSLVAELEAIAARHPAAQPFVQQVLRASPAFDARAPLIVAAATAAGLAVYLTIALLMKLQKAEQLPNTSALGRPAWQRFLERARAPLGPLIGSLPESELKLLVIEQHALACDDLDTMQVADLARRHEHETSMLTAAGTAKRDEFLRDKFTWLLDEIRLDELYVFHHQLADKLTSMRAQYVGITGKAAVRLAEAAHRVAELRYRVALDDPSITPEDIKARLQRRLHAADDGDSLVQLEPELLGALLYTKDDALADHNVILYLQSLRDDGRLRPASEEERREATEEGRRLASLIYPVLAQPGHYGEISPPNMLRLRKIWDDAWGTHRGRVQLSRDNLLDYRAHLRDWKEEALRILRNLSFPRPSLLLQGETLDARHADLQRAMDDVQRRLRALQAEDYELENNPLYEECLRVIAMTEEERAGERERMEALAEAWNAEARQLAAQLEARDSSRGAAQPPGERRGGESAAQREQRP